MLKSKPVCLQWNVLDWNEAAIKFYANMPYINLTKTEGWFNFRLDPAGIETLAKSRSA